MPAVAGAFSWNLPATTISPQSEDSGDPQVTAAPDGTTTVVWLKVSDATVYVATRRPGQTGFGTPQLLSDPFGTDQAPRVAVSPDGATTVIWRNTGADLIQAVTRPAGSTTFGPIEVISEGGLQAFSPELVAGADGSVTAIWEARDNVEDPPYSTYKQVKAATRQPGESEFDPARSVSKRGDFPSPSCPTQPQVATAPEGTTTAVWALLDESGNCEIQSATRAASEDFPDPSTTPPDVLSAPGEEGDSPQLAVGPDQQATGVWRNASSPFQINSATRAAGAASFGDPVDISEGQEGSDPQVAVAPDGQTTAIWTAGAGNLINGATRAGGSNAWGSVVTVSTENPAFPAKYYPKVAVAKDGRATVVWTDVKAPGNSDPDIGRSNVMSTTRAPGSTVWPAAKTLAAEVGPWFPPTPSPDLVIGANGQVTAVWKAKRGDNDVIQAVSSTVTNSLAVTSLKPKVTRKSILITSKAKVSGAGKIAQRATTGSGKKTKTWCRASKSAGKGDTYTLKCNLGRKGRSALRKRALKLTLRTTFTPTAGKAITVNRKLPLKRRR